MDAFPVPDCSPTFSSHSSDPPARVSSALSFLRFCHDITRSDNGRDLNPNEQRAYNAALDLLTQYFRCELDLGDVPPRHEDIIDDCEDTKNHAHKSA